jgi:hypothetical protein
MELDDLEGEEIGESSAELGVGPTVLANRTPRGLVLVGNELYWTSNSIDPVGPDSSTVWRSVVNNPHSEVPIHQRVGDTNETSFYEFASTAHATVGGVPSVFFVYNYSDDGFAGAYIGRIPASGGAPLALVGASDYVMGDLESDGAHLFWSDWSYLLRVPAAGGQHTILRQARSPILALSASFVYHARGSNVERVPKTGGTAEVVVTASNPVTALHVFAPTSAFGTVYWGEQGGAIRSQPVVGGAVTTYQETTAGRMATSVGFDGTRVLWTDCLTSNAQCAVRVHENGAVTTVSSGMAGAGKLQWDATSMFWGQTGALMKYVH